MAQRPENHPPCEENSKHRARQRHLYGRRLFLVHQRRQWARNKKALSYFAVRKAANYRTRAPATGQTAQKNPREGAVSADCFEPGFTRWAPCWYFRRLAQHKASHRAKEGLPIFICWLKNVLPITNTAGEMFTAARLPMLSAFVRCGRARPRTTP